MCKENLTKFARECGYEANYSGKTKTMFLKPISEIKGHVQLIGRIKKFGYKYQLQ